MEPHAWSLESPLCKHGAGNTFLSIAIALSWHCPIVLVLHSFELLLVALVQLIVIKLHFVAENLFKRNNSFTVCAFIAAWLTISQRSTW
jgi:hypothetical protein